MIAESIKLTNYRNYRNLDLELNNTLNIFVGKNAQGKTNILEAIYVISTGNSHRTNKDNELDFTSHQAKKVYEMINGELQEKLKFGTDAFGVFDSVQIETIDGIEYITANCRVWKRFELCCQIIQDRFDNDEPLNTSWEISIVNSDKQVISGKLVKVINDGIFIGHALLSKYTSPAYNCSGMLEVAEEQENTDLAKALFEDLSKINEISCEENLEQLQEMIIENSTETMHLDIHTENNSVENKLNNNIEEKGGVVDMAENKIKTEVSSVTTNDLYNKLNVAINAIDTNRWICISRVYPYEFRAVGYDWCAESDDDYVEFKYVVNSDESISIISETPVKMTFVPSTQINDQMQMMQTQMDEMNDELSEKKTELSTKLDEIVALGESIQSLKDQLAEKETIISELEPLRVEKAEAEAKKAEEEKAEKKKCLSEMLVSSKYFTQEEIETSETIQEAISSLDESAVKGILAEKVIAEAQKIKDEPKEETNKKQKTETSEIEVSTDLNANQEYEYKSSASVLLNYARRNIKK
jgi:hypothetical protein